MIIDRRKWCVHRGNVRHISMGGSGHFFLLSGGGEAKLKIKKSP